MTKCEAEGSGPGYDRPFFTPQNLVFFLLLDDDGWERTPRKIPVIQLPRGRTFGEGSKTLPTSTSTSSSSSSSSSSKFFQLTPVLSLSMCLSTPLIINFPVESERPEMFHHFVVEYQFVKCVEPADRNSVEQLHNWSDVLKMYTEKGGVEVEIVMNQQAVKHEEVTSSGGGGGGSSSSCTEDCLPKNPIPTGRALEDSISERSSISGKFYEFVQVGRYRQSFRNGRDSDDISS
ncbi:hypothetical protein RUM44_010190 [Polyplax serrata]|uniref:Uncharacterized protein n=1 Tax=Polyplax serrata TaxID=468196 RepID=A0ABR1AVG4_POLSC